MVSINIKTLIPRANRPLYYWFIKSDVAIASLQHLLKMTVLNKRLNRTDSEMVG